MKKKHTITTDEIRNIANLSRVGLTDEEVKRAASDTAGILNHFSAIQNINIKKVKTADGASGLKNITRKDEAEEQSICTHDSLLSNAPNTKNGHIKVNRTL